MSAEILHVTKLLKIVISNQIELSKQIKIVNDTVKAYNSSIGGMVNEVDIDRLRNCDDYDFML